MTVPEGPGSGVMYDWDRATEIMVDSIEITAESKWTQGIESLCDQKGTLAVTDTMLVDLVGIKPTTCGLKGSPTA